MAVSIPIPTPQRLDKADHYECMDCHATIPKEELSWTYHQQWHVNTVSAINNALTGFAEVGNVAYLTGQVETLVNLVAEQEAVIRDLQNKAKRSERQVAPQRTPTRKKRGTAPLSDGQTAVAQPPGFTVSPKTKVALPNVVSCPECHQSTKLRGEDSNTAHYCGSAQEYVHLCMECGKVVHVMEEYQQIIQTKQAMFFWAGHQECVKNDGWLRSVNERD